MIINDISNITHRKKYKQSEERFTPFRNSGRLYQSPANSFNQQPKISHPPFYLLFSTLCSNCQFCLSSAQLNLSLVSFALPLLGFSFSSSPPSRNCQFTFGSFFPPQLSAPQPQRSSSPPVPRSSFHKNSKRRPQQASTTTHWFIYKSIYLGFCLHDCFWRCWCFYWCLYYFLRQEFYWWCCYFLLWPSYFLQHCCYFLLTLFSKRTPQLRLYSYYLLAESSILIEGYFLGVCNCVDLLEEFYSRVGGWLVRSVIQ